MKKFLSFILLFGCLSLCMTTSAEAQTQAIYQRVTNNTDCAFFVQVVHGLGCDDAMPTTTPLFVGPNETEIILVGQGQYIFNARGFYAANGSSCRFSVGIDCAGGPLIDNVTCGILCGDYTAELIPGYGVIISN